MAASGLVGFKAHETSDGGIVNMGLVGGNGGRRGGYNVSGDIGEKWVTIGEKSGSF